MAARGEALPANRFVQPILKICAVDWVVCFSTANSEALQWQFSLCLTTLLLVFLFPHCMYQCQKKNYNESNLTSKIRCDLCVVRPCGTTRVC